MIHNAGGRPGSSEGILPNVRGFTVLEIMVSTAVLLILSVILFSIMGGVLDATKSETARMDAYANGRAVLAMMERDLMRSYVEKSTNVNANWAWGGVPAGTEFNWRNLYVIFTNEPAVSIPTTNAVTPQPLFAITTHARPGSSVTNLQAVGYALSNGFLLRMRTNSTEFCGNPANFTDFVNAMNGDATEIVAENVYWARVDTYDSGSSVDRTNTWTGDPTNQIPKAVRLTIRAGQRDLMGRIRRNGDLASSLLYLPPNFTTNNGLPVTDYGPITNRGIREITTVIDLNNTPFPQ